MDFCSSDKAKDNPSDEGADEKARTNVPCLVTERRRFVVRSIMNDGEELKKKKKKERNGEGLKSDRSGLNYWLLFISM